VDCGLRTSRIASGGARRRCKLLVLLSLDVGNQQSIRSKERCKLPVSFEKECICCGEVMTFL
jgi:hypothetical protein